MAIKRHLSSLRLIRVVSVLALLFVCVHGMPAQSPSPLPYAVQQFGLTTGTNSAAYDVGDYGQVIVGRSRSSSGAYHGFVDGIFGRLDVGTLGGGDSTAFGVYYGLVVGQAQLPSGEYRAFAYDASARTMINLGTLGGNWSAAYAVNSDVIVGASRLAGTARLQAFRYVGGVMQALPIDRGGDSVARGINLSGDVVGYACTAGNARCRGFIATPSGVVDLGSATANSVANALNDHGQVVGAMAVGGATHAFLYDGTMLDLGTLGGSSSEALAISERGEVVGWSHVAGGAEHAFLWRNGAMIDLNTLLPPNSGWVLQQAKAVSDGGQIVGYGTFGGVRRAFLLTPPTDLIVHPSGVRSQNDSNLPYGGLEAGRHIPYTTSVFAGSSAGVTIYGAKLVHTVTGPAEFTEGYIFAYDPEDRVPCQVTPTTVTCDLPPLDSPGLGHETFARVRTTGPGTVTHVARLVTVVSDPNPSNNQITETNRAVAMTSFTIAPTTVAAGSRATATIGFTGFPPAGGASVRLTSSRPDVVRLPATFEATPWNEVAQFHIVPGAVSATTPVQITATYGLVTITRTLTVVPTGLRQLYLTPTTVIGGCGTSSGRVLLSGVAPAGGAVVPLSDTNPSASVPASVTVPAGSDSVTFTVPTTAVTSNVSGTVTASYGGVSQSLALTVRPIRANAIALSPNPATGGTIVSGTVSLECPAAPGNVVVSLRTSNAAAATPVTSTVTVPAGATSAAFSVRTFAVTASTPVSIEAWVFGVRRTATLTVTP